MKTVIQSHSKVCRPMNLIFILNGVQTYLILQPFKSYCTQFLIYVSRHIAPCCTVRLSSEDLPHSKLTIGIVWRGIVKRMCCASKIYKSPHWAKLHPTILFLSIHSLAQPYFLNLIIGCISPKSSRTLRISPGTSEPLRPSSERIGEDRFNSSLFDDATEIPDDFRSDELVIGLGGLLGCLTMYTVIMHHFANAVFHMGMKLRVSSTSVIYRKVNRMYCAVPTPSS